MSWSSSNTDCLPGGGATTWDFHKIHPSNTLNSALCLQKGWNWSSTCVVGHPCSINWCTRDKTGSVSVHYLMLEALTVVPVNRFTRSPGRQSELLVCGWDKRLSASAFPRSLPGLWRMVKEYALDVKVHRIILDEAVGDIALELVNMNDNGRWSDSIMKCLP